MYLHQALHNGSPEFMFAVLVLLVALVMSQTVRGSGIAQHPYAKPYDGGELASDLPPESIGRPELEPVLIHRPMTGGSNGLRKSAAGDRSQEAS